MSSFQKLTRSIFSVFNRNVHFNRQFSVGALSSIHHVFVGNLPLGYSLDAINDYLLTNKVTGYSGPRLAISPKGKFRGFAFLDFDSKELAENAITLLKDTEAGGRIVKVDLTDSKDSASKGRRDGRLNEELQLFIGNLPFKFTHEDLTELIKEQIGKETPFKVKLHNDGTQSLGFCHITFANEADLTTVTNNLHNYTLMGRVINVERAVPKNKGSDKHDTHDESVVLSAEEEEEFRLSEKARLKKEQEERFLYDDEENTRQHRPSMERRLLRQQNQRALTSDSRYSFSSSRDTHRSLSVPRGGRPQGILGAGSGSGNRGLAVRGGGELKLDWRKGKHGDSNRERYGGDVNQGNAIARISRPPDQISSFARSRSIDNTSETEDDTRKRSSRRHEGGPFLLANRRTPSKRRNNDEQTISRFGSSSRKPSRRTDKKR